jgi:hypothetical protein
MRATPAPRVLSYGAGLDSFALLVEALRRGERPDVVAFVDVADPAHEDPGEWPSTYRHLARRLPCLVCGAFVRASKATGCGYLDAG